MRYSFELKKYGERNTLKFIEHHPVGENDTQQRFVFSDEELDLLRMVLGTKVISYDMKNFEERLMNLESRYDAEVQGLIDEQNILSHHLVEVDNLVDRITTDLALLKFFTRDHLEKVHGNQDGKVQTDGS